MANRVLGLDLATASLPDAIAAMVEAWYQAQAVNGGNMTKSVQSPEKDPWFQRLSSWSIGAYASGADGSVSPLDKFTIQEALVSAGLETGTAAAMRAGAILRAIGYVKKRELRKTSDGQIERLILWSRQT